jgi:hypothetical protein
LRDEDKALVDCATDRRDAGAEIGPYAPRQKALRGGLLVLIVIVAAATRLMPHSTAAEATMLHFHLLHDDDDLIAKP